MRAVEEKGKRLFIAEGAERTTLTIPGPFDPARFNQVAVEAMVERGGWLELAFLRDGEPVMGMEPELLPDRPLPTAFVFDFLEAQEHEEPFDELRVNFVTRADRPLRIGAIELLHRPLARWLADPEDEPALIEVGSDSRRGWVLTSERPLELAVDVAPGAYTLSFSLARPERVLTAESEVSVRAQVSWGQGEPLVEDVVLEGASGWTWVESFTRGSNIPFRFEATFTLRGAGADEVACAIADVHLRVADPVVEPRTVLLVTSDTHRADYLGAARSDVAVDTPALDALAAGGVLFEDCWSSTNITNPSHIALMTGVSPRDTRVVTNTVAVADAANTLAEEFHAAGFRTWAVLSVTNLGHAGSGLGQGFDRVATPSAGSVGDAGEAVDRVLEWLPAAQGSPLFLWVHLFDAHTPYAPPPSHDRRYYTDGRDPFAPAGGDESVPPARILPAFLEGLHDPAFPEAQYRAEISYLDQELGRLLDHERFRDAVVAVTADHGESLGEHDTYYNHVLLYPDTLHVPLVLRAPGVPRGRRVKSPVRQIDVARTLLDLAGLAAVEFPGGNVLASLDNPREEPRFALAAQGNAASIQRGDDYLILHLIAHREPQSLRGFARHRVELFDLATDPGCERDLVEAEPERARLLRAELLTWLGELSPDALVGEASDDPARLEELEALGYVGHETTFAGGEWFERDDCKWCERFQ